MISNFPCVNTNYLNQYLDNIEEQDKYNDAVRQEYDILYADFINVYKREPIQSEEYSMWDTAESKLQAKIETADDNDY